MVDPATTRSSRKAAAKSILSFLASNVLGRLAGLLIDIFLLITGEPGFLNDYFTAQACVLFPFALSSAFCVHSQKTGANGRDIAAFSVLLQALIIAVFADFTWQIATLLILEAGVLFWLFSSSPPALLMHLFSWSGVGFNVALLVAIFVMNYDILAENIALFFAISFYRRD